MTQMICDVCYKTFPGPGTLCPDCATIEGVVTARKLAAIHSRLGSLTFGDAQPQIAPASRSLRVLASFVEVLIYIPVALLAFMVSTLFLEPGDMQLFDGMTNLNAQRQIFHENPRLFLATQIEYGLTMLFFTLYLFVFEASPLQGSIGKVMLGLKIVDRHGDRPSFARILVRTASRWVLSLPVLAVFLGLYLWRITNCCATPAVVQNLVLAGTMITMVGMSVMQGFDDGVALFSKYRQTLHDMLAETFVVVDVPPTMGRILLCVAISVPGNAVLFWGLLS